MRNWLALALALGGCGKITLAPDDQGVSPEDLAMTLADLAGVDGGGGPVQPQIAAFPDVVGFPTKLDATNSVDAQGRALSFSWHFVSVPAGSAVADTCVNPTPGFSTCFSSPTDAMPSFEPDRGGDYVVELTATAGSDQAKLRQTVTVPTVAVFYSDGRTTATTVESGVQVVRSDGTGVADVACRVSTDGGLSGGDSTPLFSWLLGGVYALRTFDPATGPSQVAFMQVIPPGGSTVDSRLFSGTDQSRCSTAPVTRVDDTTSPPPNYFRIAPRFSPDGSRLVYMDVPNNFGAGSPRVVTVGVDGTNLHVISTNSNITFMAMPFWIDGQTVAWLQDDSGGIKNAPHFVIHKHVDASGGPFASDTVLMDCGGTSLNPPLTIVQQIEVASLAPLTLVAAASRQPVTDYTAPTTQTIDIYKLSGLNCTPTNLSNNAPPGTWSRDFSLTPDGKLVAYATNTGTMLTDGGSVGTNYDIWLLSVDGTMAPTKLAGDPAKNDFGPRFTASGRQLVWTQTSITGQFNIDAGLRGRGIMIINRDGTHQHALVGESGGAFDGHGVISGSSTGVVKCSVAGDLDGGLTALVGGAIVALLILGIVRRRATLRD
jgi:hypothetical protein